MLRLFSKYAVIVAIQLLALQSVLVPGVAAAEEPLPPDEAFKLKVSVRGSDTVVAEFTPAKDHYLYKNKTFFALKNASGVLIKEVRLPPGEVKNDPFLGTMETYKKPFRAEIILDRKPTAKRLTLLASYQGCNEKIGVCYPPQQKSFDLVLP
ncbi:MAG: protein-disulfide reductase DsbD N-terminal domain-containing protein [Betaproteobacteria bacterium]|nr:protein-disulfide reductase DsbD N-terminal domain-containing protein [Betaproteobacteria bacterium]